MDQAFRAEQLGILTAGGKTSASIPSAGGLKPRPSMLSFFGMPPIRGSISVAFSSPRVHFGICATYQQELRDGRALGSFVYIERNPSFGVVTMGCRVP
jgi:hypothetical protein